MNSKVKWQRILLSPIAFAVYFLLAGLAILIAQGPFYLHQNGDVNYNYLLVGLDYLYGESAAISDQPALFTKIWNALIIGIMYTVRSIFIDSGLKADVIQNGELYLYAITIPIVLICTYCYWKLLVVAKRAFSSTTWLVGAVAIFFSSTIFLSLWVNKPEPYLVIAGLWICILYLKKHWLREQVPLWHTVACILFAILSKVTILPLLLPFIVIYQLKDLIKIAGSFLISLFIIIFIWYEEFSYFSEWILNTAMHTGAHGSGDEGFWDNASLLPSIIKVCKAHSLLILSISMGMYTSITKDSTFLRMMTLGYLLFILIILKNPSNHYFIPCYALLPVYVMSIADLINLSAFAKPVVVGTLLILGVRAISLSSSISYKYDVVQEYTAPTHIQTYYSSTPSYALFSANRLQKEHFTNELTSLYPNDTFYWFDNHFYTHQKKLDHDIFENRHIKVSGTSDYVEKDSLLHILKRKEDGVNLYYEVRLAED